MFRQYFCSEQWVLHAWVLGALMLVIATVSSLIMFAINMWKGDFYAEIERALNDKHNHTTPTAAYYELGWRWVWLSVPLPILTALNYYVTSVWSFSWRQALTDDYQQRFDRRRTQLALEGVSQRIQEDTRGLASQINRLGEDFFGSIITLCVFAPVLYSKSPTTGYRIPGVLLWFCLGCNAAGFLLSMVIGRPLVALQYNIERHEAAYRKELVLAEDQVTCSPGALGGWQSLFRAVREAYYRLFGYQSGFFLWIGSFDRFMIAVPIFLLAPSIYDRSLSLGDFMQAYDAYVQVHSSMSAVAHAWPDINDVRCIARRLYELEARLDEADPGETAPLISPSVPDTTESTSKVGFVTSKS